MHNTAYHQDFGQPIRYRFDQIPDDPDGQVRAAIARMGQLIRADACAPMIEERALMALTAGDGDPVLGIWRTIKPLLRFRQDSEIARGLKIDDARLGDVVEVFIRPLDQELLIRTQGQGFEDCDGFVLYGAALLTALGIKVKLVTVAADPEDASRYSHVYLAAYLDGRRVPLDFSHGQYPGWECQHLGRKREWSLDQASDLDWLIVGLLLVIAASALYKRSSR